MNQRAQELHLERSTLAPVGKFVTKYSRCLVRAAVLLTVLVVGAWAIDVVTQPSDPQIGLTYVFSPLYAVLALVAVWVTVALIARRRRLVEPA